MHKNRRILLLHLFRVGKIFFIHFYFLIKVFRYDNGDDIVQFLDAIEVPALPEFPGGPRRTVMEKVWPASLIRPAFYKHLYQTIVEAVQYLNEDYRGSIQTADQATSHMLVVADILTNGLVRIVQPQDLLTAAKNAEITFEQSRKSTTIFEK